MSEYTGTSVKDKIKSNVLCMMILSKKVDKPSLKTCYSTWTLMGGYHFSVIRMGLKAF